MSRAGHRAGRHRHPDLLHRLRRRGRPARPRSQVARAGAERPLAIIDLALPHDVDPAAADLPGVTLIGLRRLADDLRDTDAGREVAGVREIVDQEIGAFLAARRQASVTPTVVALRTMATGSSTPRSQRLMARLPDLDPAARAEVEHAVRRVADKLLHQPTVRVKELANEAGAVSYAAALAELFALDPDAVDAVTRPEKLVMSAPLRVGTRASLLARTQSTLVADRLAETLGVEVELVEVTTEGDVNGAPLASLGGAGVFVSALRDALLDGKVDVAVHSLKDLPTARPTGSRWPRSRCARTRATCSSPATASPSASCRPAASSAPAPRAGSPSCTPSASAWRSRAFAATSTPGPGRSRRVSSTEWSWRVPDWPGSDGSTSSPR